MDWIDDIDYAEFTEDSGESLISRRFKYKTSGEDEEKDRKGLVRAKDIKIGKINWLWYPYIPFGMLSMISGDPGTGKSFITAALASLLSKGEPFPGEVDTGRDPMNVLLLSVEDDLSTSLAPRLKSLNGDLGKIYLYDEQDDVMILNKSGIKAIREMITATKAKFVVIDPIVAFIGASVNINNANEVREVMRALAKIAKEEKIAIVIVRHNRKEQAGSQSKAIYSGMGSIDFTASVRSEMAVNESKNGLKFVNHIKSNIGPIGQSITYTITSEGVELPTFKWGDFTTWPMGTDASKGIISKRFKNEEKVKQWIHDILKDCPDGMAATTVYGLGKAKGFPATKLDHAKKGVAISVKRGLTWVWKLDTSAPIAGADADKVD